MLREDLQKALKESMLAHDAETTGAVRLIIAGMKEKDVDARGKGAKEATEAELLSMMQTMIKQRNDSIKCIWTETVRSWQPKNARKSRLSSVFCPSR